MPDQDFKFTGNHHTDTLIDLLDLQDRAAADMTTMADHIRRRSRMIRAHLAAHAGEIDFQMVFEGERKPNG